MRGSPLRRAAAVGAFLLLALIPLLRLTGGTAPSIQLSPTAAANEGPSFVTVILAHPATSWSVLYLGEPVAGSNQPARPVIIPQEGADFQVRVEWPKGTPRTAIQISVTAPDGTIRSSTAWGKSVLDEVITVR